MVLACHSRVLLYPGTYHPHPGSAAAEVPYNAEGGRSEPAKQKGPVVLHIEHVRGLGGELAQIGRVHDGFQRGVEKYCEGRA